MNNQSTLEEREADLAKRAAEVAAHVRAVNAAQAKRDAAESDFQRAHAEHSCNISDPLTNSAVQSSELVASGQRLQSAKKALDASDAALAVVRERVGNTGERSRRIAQERAVLKQERARAADRERKTAILGWAVHGLSLLRDDYQAVTAEWERQPKDEHIDSDLTLQRGAGLVPVQAPAGLVMPTDASGRTALVDSIIRGIAVSYPELLAELPADLAAELSAKIQRDKQRRARYYPAPVQWLADTLHNDELTVLRERFRIQRIK